MTDHPGKEDAWELSAISNAVLPLEQPGVRGQVRVDDLSDRLTVYTVEASATAPAEISLSDGPPAEETALALCLPLVSACVIDLPGAEAHAMRHEQPLWSLLGEHRATLKVPCGRFKLVGLSITARMLEEHAHTLGRLHPQLKQVFSERPSPFALAAQGNRQLARVAAELVSAPFTGALRALYQEAKALELIALSLAAVGAEAERATTGLRDLDRLHEARERLLADIAVAPTLAQLCRAVGLNKNKLVRGFREQFGAPPYELLRQARLDHSRTLLEEGRLSIGEIAARCGYDHPANFTHAFTARFGLPPSRWRRSNP